MALQKNIIYTTEAGEQINTTYHVLAAVFIDYKSPQGGNVVGIIQSYFRRRPRSKFTHYTLSLEYPAC